MSNITSKPRCKPGDLAVVTRPKHLQNLGLVVLVIRRNTNEDGYGEGLTGWICASEGRAFVGEFTCADTGEVYLGQDFEWLCSDESLMPLPGFGAEKADAATKRNRKPAHLRLVAPNGVCCA